jgi:hypothetical protein
VNKIRGERLVFDRIPVSEAFRAAVKGNSSKWPTRSQPGRMDPICLPDFIPSFSMETGEGVLTIGSCFARNIEQSLKAQGFIVPALNFQVPKEEIYSGTDFVPGILNKYTPFSMLNEVEFAFGTDDGSKFLIQISDNMFLDQQLHTDIPVTRKRGLERRAELRDFFSTAISECRIIVVTLGLAEAWWDDLGKVYLNETPNQKAIKSNPGRFYFELLSPEKVIQVVGELLVKLKKFGRRDQKVLLTVSPVPFARSFSGNDVIVANCYSKSVLRVAAEVSVRNYNWVDYYPSYESVTLTSRDLAWEDDYIHVRSNLVDSNVKRMLAAYHADGSPDELSSPLRVATM